METSFRGRDAVGAVGAGIVATPGDPQRPPVYNAEDYSEYLRKYCKAAYSNIDGKSVKMFIGHKLGLTINQPMKHDAAF